MTTGAPPDAVKALGAEEPMASLPPLREMLDRFGLRADKGFGQHFLLDLNLTRKIVRLAELPAAALVVEVGPGPGGLTRALLEAGCTVLAIEADARFLPLLDELRAAAGERLHLVPGDALKVDLAGELAARGLTGRAHIVSNLPYNVGSPLLAGWLTRTPPPASMTLMFQREVVDRIVAPPGRKDYGRLAVLTGALAHARRVLDLPPGAFTPPPKVSSAVVRITPLDEPLPAGLVERLQTVTAAAFGQRRKKLRSALGRLGGEALCAAAGVDPDARAETIPVAGFVALAGALA